MTHPTLEVITLRKVRRLCVTNWFVNFPKLQLLENYLTKEYRCNYFALCRSAGLPLMKPAKGTKAICILHLKTLTEGGLSLDISLLPPGPDCEVIILAAKSYTNL